MNVLRRRPQRTLQLLTLSSWRPQPLTRNLDNFLRTNNDVTGSRLSCCQYSSVTKPQEEQQDHKKQSTERSDPFGIGEELGSADKSSILVQGFYGRESASTEKAPPLPPKTEQPPSPPKETGSDDPDKSSRLKLYDSWLKQRVHQVVAERSESGVAESYRETHYGQVRMDSDNQPMFRPRGNDPRFTPQFKLRHDSPRAAFRRKARDEEESSEPITETISADRSVRVRASEFLNQIQGKKAGEEDLEGEQEEDTLRPRERLVIERIITPKHRTNTEEAETLQEALVMDSNKIPKEYLLPDYNLLTKEDMWLVMQKTIIFQNDFILAINKPSGIPVHSKSRDCRHTVIHFLEKFADLAKCEKIYPLHRIDKETTGVLLFAKDPKVAAILKDKFAHQQINKVYLGVAKMCPKVREGTIKIPIGEGLIPGTNKYRRVLRPDLREFGVRPTTRSCVQAITHFKVLHSIREASFVEIEPETGAKHQIRVHFGMGLGCPILGDHKYSHRDRLAPQRLHPYVLHQIKLKQSKVREMPLHLHCNKISFTLPPEFTNSQEPIYIHAKIPQFMRYTLKRLSLIK